MTAQATSVETPREIQDWPDESRKIAENAIEALGPPDEVAASMLIWHEQGPWKRSIVHREPVHHEWPMPHEDALEQTIRHTIPPSRLTELGRFDGSVSAMRTKGELSATCQAQEANFLALNLAHRVLEGAIDAEEARKKYTQQMMAFTRGEEAPLMQGFDFEPAGSDDEVADADERDVPEEDVQRAKEEGKGKK